MKGLAVQSLPDNRNTEVICKVILTGSYVIVAAASFLLAIGICLGRDHAASRLAVCAVALVYVALAHLFIKQRRTRVAAYMLTGFYMILASGVVIAWGVNTPLGTLLFALVIVVAGILLAARHSLVAAAIASLVLLGVQTATAMQLPLPYRLSTSVSTFADVFAYATIFGMLALVTWLFNREVHRSSLAAQKAQEALRKQKDNLEQEVKRRTAQLRRVQMEEMQQMYRFSEMGQLGVNLLHDIANHMTALTLEVEGLQAKRKSNDMKRIQQTTQYLEEVVQTTRDRMYGAVAPTPFDVIGDTTQGVNLLQYKAAEAGVKLTCNAPQSTFTFVGDSISLRQVVIILTSNAIDAYRNTKKQNRDRRVEVTITNTEDHVQIAISDWGRGITRQQRKLLFKPFATTKKAGFGLGLFLAKQTIETHFDGTLKLHPTLSHTEFVITIPRQANASKAI